MALRSPYHTDAAEGMRALGGVHVYVARSGLPKPLLDLVYLRASQINGCAYCIDLHARDALKGGAAADKLFLLSAWREAGATFTPRERAALAWTEVVTDISRSHASDEDYAAAAAEFSGKELADLTLAVSLMNAYNRMAIAFRRPPEPPSRGA
jgi:AhpD family alkylhydroperoxidase